MQKIVILILGSLILVNTLQASTVTEAIRLIKTGQEKKGITTLEEINKSSQDTTTIINTAYILATAPKKYLKTKPFVYAEFALKNDKSLNQKQILQLMKISGDGLYQSGKFKSASNWYKKILDLNKVNSKHYEYATYKLAWSYMNLNQQSKSFSLLSNWLINNESSLKESLIYDLGRSLSESILIEKQDTIFDDKLKLTLSEKTEFAKGFIKGVKRQPVPFKQVYYVVKNMAFNSIILNELVLVKPYNRLNPCVVLKYYSKGDKALWSGKNSQKLVNSCVVKVLKQKPVNMEKVNILLQVYKPVKEDIQSTWMSAKLNLLINNKIKSCNILNSIQFTKNSPLITEVSKDVANVCTTKKLEQWIVKNRKYLNLKIINYMMSENNLSQTYKMDLLKSINFKNQQQKIDTLQSLLLATPDQQKFKILNSFCQDIKSCHTLWEKFIKPQKWSNSIASHIMLSNSKKIDNLTITHIELVHNNLDKVIHKMTSKQKTDYLYAALAKGKLSRKTDLTNSVVKLLSNLETKNSSVPVYFKKTKFIEDLSQYQKVVNKLNTIDIRTTNNKNLKQNLMYLKNTFNNSKKFNWKNTFLIKKIIKLFNYKLNHMIVAIDTLKHKHLGDSDWLAVKKEVATWKE